MIPMARRDVSGGGLGFRGRSTSHIPLVLLAAVGFLVGDPSIRYFGLVVRKRVVILHLLHPRMLFLHSFLSLLGSFLPPI